MYLYQVGKAKQVDDGPWLIQIRDTRGYTEWTGDYSDDSDLWTEELKEAYGFTEARNDGYFFVNYDDYRSSFWKTFINYDTSDMFRDDWLILDDRTKRRGKDKYCGRSCTRHEFTLTSSVKQRVMVYASTWEERAYPDTCWEWEGLNNDWLVGYETYHVLDIEGLKY